MEQAANFKVKGWVKISEIIPGKSPKILVDQKNAIDVNSNLIVSKLLGDTPDAKLDTISILKLSAVLATQDSLTYSFPSPGQVRLTARFLAASWNGNFDELTLGSTAYGIFSKLTGLNVTTQPQFDFEVEWTITVTLL